MSYSVPDGSKVFLGTAFGTAIDVTAISNANPAVVSAASHGLSAGDVVIVKSGWQKINERVFKVANPLTGSFELEGLDTSSTTDYPVGSSAGTVQEITTLTQITQILGIATSGGEQEFATVSPLESDFDIQIPTKTGAQTLELTIGDDDTLAGYQALKAAANARAIRPLKLLNKNGSYIFYYGYVSLNETPTKTKGSVDAVKSTFNLLSRPVRYAS